MKTHPDKSKVIDGTIIQIERQFGKGSITKLGSHSVKKIPVIPTGSILLDKALGIGGLPKGRVTEIFGSESSGKTTLALHTLANVQKQGGIATFIDAEHALDISYAKKLGVNCDELIVAQPDTGEQALEITDILVKSGAVDIIVIDSVAALVPRAEIESEMGESCKGLQAKLMSQALRKLTGKINKTMASIIFINQIRMNIGQLFGNPETTSGGNALKFYSSIRLDIRRVKVLKKNQEIIGNRTRVRVVKNKLAPPFKEAEFDIMYGKGISETRDLIEMAIQTNTIKKSGKWYYYNNEQIGQEVENIKFFLEENTNISDEISMKIKKKLNLWPIMTNIKKNT